MCLHVPPWPAGVQVCLQVSSQISAVWPLLGCLQSGETSLYFAAPNNEVALVLIAAGAAFTSKIIVSPCPPTATKPLPT